MHYNNVSTIAVILVPPANRSKNVPSILKRICISFFTVVFEKLYFRSVLTQMLRSTRNEVQIQVRACNPPYPPPIGPYGVGEEILGVAMLIFMVTETQATALWREKKKLMRQTGIFACAVCSLLKQCTMPSISDKNHTADHNGKISHLRVRNLEYYILR
jgi:hypothetical protein